MVPSREEAERLLCEGEALHPGPWGNHSRVAARCAERIARACGESADTAYVCGLLHDIGRRFGTRHLGHVVDGYRYMLSLGYDEVARACLTHSFTTMHLSDYVGKNDLTPQEQEILEEAMQGLELTDMDRLIQLCDCLAGADGVMDMEARMADVERRYGYYPEEKREVNRRNRAYFEKRMGRDVYEVVCGGEDTL
ncbi:MAG: HD domain-containing protein [Clostridia bacterium]|nr:HD domain-containing protein [Clostridia bacterium]